MPIVAASFAALLALSTSVTADTELPATDAIFSELTSEDDILISLGITHATRAHDAFFEAALWNVVANHTNSALRQAAVTAIGGLQWPDNEDALNARIAHLASVLRDDADAANVAAAQALGQYAIPAAHSALAARAAQSPLSPTLQTVVRAALDATHSSESLAHMSAWLAEAPGARGPSTPPPPPPRFDPAEQIPPPPSPEDLTAAQPGDPMAAPGDPMAPDGAGDASSPQAPVAGAQPAAPPVATNPNDRWELHGRVPFVIANMGLGTALLALPTELAGGNNDALLGAGGAVLGGITSFLLTIDHPVTVGEAGYFTTLGLWGTLGGLGIGDLADPDGNGDLWGALSGEAAAILAGALSLHAANWKPGDFVLANLLAMSTGAGAIGVQRLAQGPGGAGDAFTIGALGATLPLAMGLAPRMNFTPADAGWTTGVAALGLWEGGSLALALGSDVAGGVLVGGSAGALVGATLTQFMAWPANAPLEAVSLGASGALLAQGISLLGANVDQRTVSAWGAGLALAGFTAGSFASTSTQWSRPDVGTLMFMGVALGAHGAFLGEATGSRDAYALGDGAMFGGGLGLAAGYALSQTLHLSWADNGAWLVSDVAGALLGEGIALLADGSGRAQATAVEVGGIAGIALGLTLVPRLHLKVEDSAYLLLALGEGGWFGGWLGGITGSSIGGGVMTGAIAGLALGAAFAPLVRPVHAGDLAVATSAQTAMGIGALGLGIILDASDRALGTWLLGGGAAGLALGAWAAPHTTFTSADNSLITYGALLGSWLGTWTPLLWQDQIGSDGGGGALLGLGVGSLGTAVMSQVVRPTQRDVTGIGLTGTASAALGAGLGLIASPDDRVWTGLMDGATLVGTGVAASVIPKRPDGSIPTDALVGGISGVYGLYQAAGIASLLNASARQFGGALVFGTAAGTLTGTLLGPPMHLQTADALTLLGGGAWGVWVGAWAAALIAEGPYSAGYGHSVLLGLGTTALTTDAALALTALGVGGLVQLPPLRFAWISVSGGIGLLAGLTVSGVSGNRVTVPVGVLSGSVVGLGVGTIVTGFIDWTMPRKPAAAQATPSTDEALGWAWMPRVQNWTPSINTVPDADWRIAYPDARAPVMVTVSGDYI